MEKSVRETVETHIKKMEKEEVKIKVFLSHLLWFWGQIG